MVKPIKSAKKKWIKILAPQEFRNQLIGETVVSDPKKAIGRVVEASLFELTRDPRKQSTRIYLVITDVKNDQAHTEIIRYKVLETHLKRLIKPGKEKIMDYFDVQTKDKKLKIKLFILTKGKTSRAVCTAIRNESRKCFEDYSKEKNSSVVVGEVIMGNIQKLLKYNLKRIYPIQICEISTMEILK